MKKIIIIILIVVIIFVGIEIIIMNTKNSNQNISIDMQKLAEDLIASQIFEDDLSIIEEESVIKKYNFNKDNLKNVISYVGTGATVEEILIIELVDKDKVNETKEIIETYIKELKINFESYLPKEVYKLENCNLITKSNYIILCISNNDEKAKEIINNYINN